jgi:hypothetical protein
LKYSKSILLYRDKPQYGFFLKLILIIPAALLAGSLYFWASGDNAGSLALLFDIFLIGLIFWAAFPREYQVYEDHLRIVLGSPFSVKVEFKNIKDIRISHRTVFSVNFVTRITRTYVEIVKNRGWSIVITPADNALFVENANRALEQWQKSKR